MGSEKKIVVFLLVVFLYAVATWRHSQKLSSIAADSAKKESTMDKARFTTGENAADNEICPMGYETATENLPHVPGQNSLVPGNAPGGEEEGQERQNSHKEDIEELTREIVKWEQGSKREYGQYTAKAGDGLWQIVRHYYVSTEDAKINKIVKLVRQVNAWLKDPNKISVGDRLLLPVLSNSQFNDLPLCLDHRIAKGDTLGKLAKEHYKDEKMWRYIYDANREKLQDPHVLPVGIYLHIPSPLERGSH